jgi:hypothetical protein
MRYDQCEPGIEVSGESLGATVDAFKQYPSIVTKYLALHGVLKTVNGKQETIDRSAWYPLDKWLAAYQAIAKDVGVNSLYTIGKKIPENAVMPPHINDLKMALTTLDAYYHFVHRKNGAIMFDPATGVMLEGIGHARCEYSDEQRKALIIMETPYPCEFDRGLVTALAARFEPMTKTVHDNDSPCRKKGGPSCTYVVTW